MVKDNINRIAIGAVISLFVLFAGYVFLSSFSLTGNAIDDADKSDKSFTGMHIGEKIKVSNKLVSLNNVGNTGAIIVKVDKIIETILKGNTKKVNCLPITNEGYRYFDNKAKRMALINIGDDRSSCFKPPINTTNVTCTDSDGGKNYYVYGSTEVIDGDISSIAMDHCNSGFNITEYSNLVEYFCDKNVNNSYIIHEVLYACPDGCQDGACRALELQEPKIEKCNIVRINGFISHGLQPYWNWSDGSTGYQWFEATHTYKKNGNYPIYVTGVFGNFNLTKTVNVTVGCFPN